MKRARVTNQTVPKWAYLLFVVLAAFVLYLIFQHRVNDAKVAQPPVRPVLVARVITKDVPVYLNEIGFGTFVGSECRVGRGRGAQLAKTVACRGEVRRNCSDRPNPK